LLPACIRGWGHELNFADANIEKSVDPEEEEEEEVLVLSWLEGAVVEEEALEDPAALANC
jgi:hypothetical protein